MALTDLEQFYNHALGVLGEYGVTEGRTSEKQYVRCARFYADARKETLAMHPWNEAKTRTIVLQESTSPLFGYSYKYAVPSDCLRIITVNSIPEGWEVEGGYILTNHIRDALSYDANSEDYVAGQYVSYDSVTYLVDTSFTSSSWATDSAAYMTSQGDDYGVIHLEYIYDLSTITSWSAMLRNAIAYRLAWKVVPSITNDPKGTAQKAILEAYYKIVLPEARSVDGQQGTLKPYYHSSWIRARR